VFYLRQGRVESFFIVEATRDFWTWNLGLGKKNWDLFLSTPSLSIDAVIDRVSEVIHLLEGLGLTSGLNPLT